MKKILLGSTALALCISGFASQAGAAAEAPTLRISGETKAVYHQYKNGKPTGEYGHGGLFAMEDTTLRFHAEGRMDWLGASQYDWLLGITGDTGATISAEENRMRVRGEWGVVYFGNHKAVDSIMARGAYGVMGATGGFDGNGMSTIIKPTGVFTGTDLAGANKYATKMTYMTPRIYGLQLGASYTPNSEHKGQGSNGAPHYNSSNKSPQVAFDTNSWSGGVNYKHEFENGFGIAMSATGIVASSHPGRRGGLNTTSLYTRQRSAQVHHTNSYALGAVAEFRGFELGVEWIDNGNSQKIKNMSDLGGNSSVNGNFDAGEAFSIAAGYTYGPNKIAAGYYNSEAKFNGEKARANIYSVTYDRKLAPGLSVFSEYNLYGLRSSQAAANYQDAVKASAGTSDGAAFDAGRKGNNAHALLLGAKLKF